MLDFLIGLFIFKKATDVFLTPYRVFRCNECDKEFPFTYDGAKKLVSHVFDEKSLFNWVSSRNNHPETIGVVCGLCGGGHPSLLECNEDIMSSYNKLIKQGVSIDVKDKIVERRRLFGNHNYTREELLSSLHKEIQKVYEK